jgi:hypothetical protein
MPLGNPPDLILLDGATGTGYGNSIGFGIGQRYGTGAGGTAGTTVNQNKWNVPVKIRVVLYDTTSGATATVLVRTSPDNATWTTKYTFPATGNAGLTIPTGALSKALAKEFIIKDRYVTLDVSAISGGSAPAVSAYLMLGAFGV